MKVNMLFRRPRLAEDSGDYPTPVADAAEILPELRGTEVAQEVWEATLAKRVKRLRDDPSADPTFHCAGCEELTERITCARRHGDEALLAELAVELAELERRHLANDLGWRLA